MLNEGDAEGVALGLLLGDEDHVAECATGALEGPEDEGAALTTPVGVDVGLEDGALLGLGEGLTVGAVVSTWEGASVACSVGLRDGCAVRVDEGALEGASLGERVGRKVGAWVRG